MDQTVSDRLGALLSCAPGLSARDFEIVAGVGRSTVAKIIAPPRDRDSPNSPNPRGTTLASIAKALGTSADYLIGGGDAPPRRRVLLALAAHASRVGDDAVQARVRASIERGRAPKRRKRSA